MDLLSFDLHLRATSIAKFFTFLLSRAKKDDSNLSGNFYFAALLLFVMEGNDYCINYVFFGGCKFICYKRFLFLCNLNE